MWALHQGTGGHGGVRLSGPGLERGCGSGPRCATRPFRGEHRCMPQLGSGTRDLRGGYWGPPPRSSHPGPACQGGWGPSVPTDVPYRSHRGWEGPSALSSRYGDPCPRARFPPWCGAAVGHSSPCPVPHLPPAPATPPAVLPVPSWLSQPLSLRSWLSSANPLILPPGRGYRGLGCIQRRGWSWVGGWGPCCAPYPGRGGLGALRGVTYQVGGWGRALPAQEFPVIYETKPKPPPRSCAAPMPLPASPA